MPHVHACTGCRSAAHNAGLHARSETAWSRFLAFDETSAEKKRRRPSRSQVDSRHRQQCAVNCYEIAPKLSSITSFNAAIAYAGHLERLEWGQLEELHVQ